jgi:hypothetical protein
MQWRRILFAGVFVALITSAVVYLSLAVFGQGMAIQAEPPPGMAEIAETARQISGWVTLVSATILTFFASVWVARNVRRMATLHGLVTGVVAGILVLILAIGFLDGEFGLLTIATFVATLVAGALGAILADPTRPGLPE